MVNIQPKIYHNTRATITRYAPGESYGVFLSETESDKAKLYFRRDTGDLVLETADTPLACGYIEFWQDGDTYTSKDVRLHIEFFQIAVRLFLVHIYVEIDDATALHTTTLLNDPLLEEIKVFSIPPKKFITIKK